MYSMLIDKKPMCVDFSQQSAITFKHVFKIIRDSIVEVYILFLWCIMKVCVYTYTFITLTHILPNMSIKGYQYRQSWYQYQYQYNWYAADSQKKTNCVTKKSDTGLVLGEREVNETHLTFTWWKVLIIPTN